METPKRIGVGIIGAGGVAPYHCQIYSGFSDICQVVAVCDIVVDRARALAERCEKDFGFSKVAVYEKFEDLLSDERVDAVSICTPPFAHTEPMLAAAERKKSVFCEGPMAGTLKECDQMLQAAQQAGIVFTVHYGHTRYTRSALMAKKVLEEGVIGKVFLATVTITWYRTQAYFDSAAWRGTWWGERGGVLFHHGRYAIDLFLWLMGPVVELHAYTGTLVHKIEIEDVGVVNLRFANGALGQILATHAAHPHPQLGDQRIAIWGSEATITVLPSFEVGCADKQKAEEIRQELEQKTPPLEPSGMAGQMRDFLLAIKEKREPVISAASTRHQVEVARAAYKSATLGLPTKLPLSPLDPFY